MIKVEHTDIALIRKEFPILHQTVHGYPLVYFDNAATTQKPVGVIETIVDYYQRYNANIHRGAHHLAHIATEAYENSRTAVGSFINANMSDEIIFTSGTTDAINLVAQSYGRKFLKEGDEILVSHLEHHSNIVPWQLIAEEKGARIKVIPINEAGEWEIEMIEQLITGRTKIVAVNHISNALGTINPVRYLTDKAHLTGAVVLIDGAQAAPHLNIDVQELGCDFYAFSGHKMYGPTGIGVLWGKQEILDSMPPYRGGGEMIRSVTFDKTTYNDLPFKYEAGTPHIGGALGLKSAIDFIHRIGYDQIQVQEKVLMEYAGRKLKEIEGIRFYGTSEDKASVISFNVDGIHAYDIGTLLDQQGIAIRTGHHCAQPLMERLCIAGTARISFAVYNTIAEIDSFVEALQESIRMLR